MGGSHSSGLSLAEEAAVGKAREMLGDSMFEEAEEGFRQMLLAEEGKNHSHKHALGINSQTIADSLCVDVGIVQSAVIHFFQLFMIPIAQAQKVLPKAVYLSLIAFISNGTTAERVQLYLCFFQSHIPTTDDFIQKGNIQKDLFVERLDSFIRILTKHHNITPSKEFSLALARMIFGEASSISEPLFCRHAHVHPFLSVMDNVFKPLALPQSETAQCLPFISTEFITSDMLSFEAMCFINEMLPLQCKSKWTRVFSDVEDGASFAKFRGKVEGAGRCVLIVRDKHGFVFGGFGSSPWEVTPHFFGGDESFVFTAAPKLCVYESSGANDNFQYLNVNSNSLPNGLGFGGQMDFFGLFISSDFQHGHCKGAPSSTYKNPPLSQEQEFIIDKVEVWKVGGTEGVRGKDGEWGDSTNSILNNRSQENSLLEMAGKTLHSKDIRHVDNKKTSNQ
eukprot:m.66342 g.66342  ORF g.66342 m.66342 type:complete len:449 (-) comp11553_c0_seq1:2896-4242(-)